MRIKLTFSKLKMMSNSHTYEDQTNDINVIVYNANTTCYTPSKTPLGDILSPSTKQPLEPYQMELGSHLPTSQEVDVIPVPSDMVTWVV